MTATEAMAPVADVAVETGRIVRFGIVGLGATSTYMAATVGATALFDLSPVDASVVGQCTSMMVSYLGHLFYSFKVESDHRTYLWRFLFITAATFAANYAITWTCTEGLNLSQATAIIAVSVAIPVASYFASRFWVFLPGLR